VRTEHSKGHEHHNVIISTNRQVSDSTNGEAATPLCVHIMQESEVLY
jgi:hypothetical protein